MPAIIFHDVKNTRIAAAADGGSGRCISRCNTVGENSLFGFISLAFLLSLLLNFFQIYSAANISKYAHRAARMPDNKVFPYLEEEKK